MYSQHVCVEFQSSFLLRAFYFAWGFHFDYDVHHLAEKGRQTSGRRQLGFLAGLFPLLPPLASAGYTKQAMPYALRKAGVAYINVDAVTRVCVVCIVCVAS